MKGTDYVIRKLKHYLDNFDDLTDEEIRQSNYFVLYKANEHIKRSTETIDYLIEQNEEILKRYNDLAVTMAHYENFINDSGLAKRYELYCKGKEVI